MCKGEAAAELGGERFESRFLLDSGVRGRGMPPKMALALKINRGGSMAGSEHTSRREATVTSGFVIHLCSSELGFHTSCVFFPSLESLFL